MVDRPTNSAEDKKPPEATPLSVGQGDGASLAMDLAREASAPKIDESAFGLTKRGVQAALHAGIQEPLTGLTQLVGMESPKLFSVPQQAELGSAAWVASTVGAGFGMVAPFLLTERATSLLLSRRTAVAASIAERVPMARSLVRPLALTTEEMSATIRFAAPVGKSVLDGAVYGFVLTPSHDPNKNFWEQRFVNAASGGLTFGVQSGLSRGMMTGWGKLGAPVESKAFQHSLNGISMRIGTNMIGGAAAGVVSAESHSLLSGHGWATEEQLKESVLSFIVTGGALDAFHVAKEIRADRKAPDAAAKGAPELEAKARAAEVLSRAADSQSRAVEPSAPLMEGGLVESRVIGGRKISPEVSTTDGASEARTKAPEPIAEVRNEPVSRELIAKQSELQKNVESRLREVDPARATEQAADFKQLVERVTDRRNTVESSKEIDSTVDAVNRLLTAEHTEVPLTTAQRLGLAKQLLFEAALPKSVDQGREFNCGPSTVLEMAQISNPGKHVNAIVDLVIHGKTTTASGAEVNLTRERLRQIDQAMGTNAYEHALMPDATTLRSLERAAQPGVDPIVDGRPSYSNWLGQMLYANVKSQTMAPEGQAAVYVKGPKDRARVEDTGERLFQMSADGKFKPVLGKEGAPQIGHGIESRDLQSMYDAITGRTSANENFVLMNTREPLEPHQGTRVLSARELETVLQSGSNRPFVLEIDAAALARQGFMEATGQPGPARHVVLVEPAMDPVRGRQYKRNGDALYNVIDTYGRANDLIGKEGVTARELFEATRQPNESPRVEGATKLEGVGNFAEVDARGLYRGRKPDSIEGIKALKEKGVTLIIDLIEGPALEKGGSGRTREQAWAEQVGVKYLNLKTSVVDFGPHSIKAAHEAIQAELAAGGKVFIHCARGVDRTGAISAMWRLTQQEGWTPRLAMAEMRQFGWNGHTPSTERMGKLVADPRDFGVKAPPEQIGAEMRNIAGRDNVHESYQRATKAAEALFEQPFMKDHPDLEVRAYEIFNQLDSRAPHLVPDGVTNVLNRISEAMENGQVSREHVDYLLKAVEARVAGERVAYDSFFDVMRDRELASKMKVDDMGALAWMAADPKQAMDVLQLAGSIRADMASRGEVAPKATGARELTGLTPDLPTDRMVEILAELPPLERQEYVANLSNSWKDGSPESIANRQRLLNAYLSTDSKYNARDAMGPFRDLLNSPDTITMLEGPQRRRFLEILLRQSNPTRGQDAMHIVSSVDPAVFTPRERALLLSRSSATDVHGLMAELRYASPETMKRAAETDNASAIAIRLISAADKARLPYGALKDAYQNIAPYLPANHLSALPRRLASVYEHLGVEHMDRMSNESFGVLLEHAASKKYPKTEEGQQKLHSLLQAAELRADSVRWTRDSLVTGPVRPQIINSWFKLLDQLPGKDKTAARFDALQRMTADDVAALQVTNKNLIKTALTGKAIESLPLQERAQLLTKLLFASHYNEAATSADKNRIVKLMTEHPEMLRELPLEDLIIARDSLAEYVGPDQPHKDVVGTTEAINHLVEMFIGEPLNGRQQGALGEGFSTHDADRLLTVLHDRAPNLSMKGLAEQFHELATELRQEGYLGKYSDWKHSAFRTAEKVNIITLGDATAGRALAYLFYKTTGIKAEVVPLKPGQEAAINGGKAVLFDSIANADPMQRALLENMQSDGRLHIPRKLQSFSEGVNMFDVAMAATEKEGGPATDRLRAKLAASIGVQPQPEAVRTYPSPSQRRALNEALSGYSPHDIELARTQATLWLAHEKLNDWNHDARATAPSAEEAPKLTDWSQIDGHEKVGQLRTSLVDRFAEFVTFPEMMSSARSLQRSLEHGNGQHPPIRKEDLLFVTNADVGGSGDLITYLYRVANGMEGRQFDKQFVTIQEAAQTLRAEQDAGKPSAKKIVSVDDVIYSGSQTETQAKKLIEQFAAEQDVDIRRRLIMATLGYHPEGRQRAAAGIEAAHGPGVRIASILEYRNLEHDVNNLWSGADPQSVYNAQIGNLFWSDKPGGFQRIQWADNVKSGKDNSWLKSGIVLPYMVPNNNLASLNLLFNHYLGRPLAHPRASYANNGTHYWE